MSYEDVISEGMATIQRLHKKNENLRFRLSIALGFLHQVREYFDSRADCDQPSGCQPQPNEEMAILVELDEIIGQIEKEPTS